MFSNLHLTEDLGDEEDGDDGIIDYDSRDPSIPHPIQADRDHWYSWGCVGEKYDGKLLSICGNSKFWEDRYRRMKSNVDANSGLVKCSRFRRVITHERSSQMMLRAVCNIAYLTPCRGEYAWELPKNVPENEFSEYWDDAWRWCSISGSSLDKPEDWADVRVRKEGDSNDVEGGEN